MKINYEPAILWPSLIFGLCAIHPLFIFPAFISIYKYRGPWLNQINQQLSTYKWWYFGFPVSAFIIGYLNVMPFVRDDLMFHVVAYKFNYDFRSIFVHSSPLPNFNLWIGFEMTAGIFHRLLGPEYAVRTVQAIGVILFYTSFFLALHKILKHREDKWLWCTIIFALCVNPMARVFLGRPDVFFTAWLISAIFLRPIFWLIIGLIIMPAYSLSIIYAPAALLLDTPWRKKIIYGSLFSISCVVFWYIYSNGGWLDIPSLNTQWVNNRLMNMSELRGSLYIFEDIYMMGLVTMLFYFITRSSLKLTSQVVAVCLLIAYFLLPNYIRYMLSVVPLIGLLCAIHVPKEIKINQMASLIILVFSALIASKSIPNIMSYENLPKFSLPQNAILLSKFNEGALHSGILHNPHAKFAPAMEIGATDQAIQKLILNLHRGESIDCEEIKKFTFTHVQENTLKIAAPCLSLSQVDGGWRLWEVK